MYKFVKTGETIEVHQSFHDDALTQIVHPGTGRRMAVKKVFTPVGVTFKGGGFYKTDSRGKSTSNTSTASESGSSAGDSSSTATTSPAQNGDSGASSSTDKSATKSATKASDSGSSAASSTGST